MAKVGTEVHSKGSYGSNANAGTVGKGGRNRLTGGVSTTGGSNSRQGATSGAPAVAKGGHQKANGDAMEGSYTPDKITSVGGIQMQDKIRRAGIRPFDDQAGARSKNSPFEPTMMTEREKLPSKKADPKTLASAKNSPRGEFGGEPGMAGAGRSTQGSGYKSTY